MKYNNKDEHYCENLNMSHSFNNSYWSIYCAESKTCESAVENDIRIMILDSFQSVSQLGYTKVQFLPKRRPRQFLAPSTKQIMSIGSQQIGYLNLYYYVCDIIKKLFDIQLKTHLQTYLFKARCCYTGNKHLPAELILSTIYKLTLYNVTMLQLCQHLSRILWRSPFWLYRYWPIVWPHWK